MDSNVFTPVAFAIIVVAVIVVALVCSGCARSKDTGTETPAGTISPVQGATSESDIVYFSFSERGTVAEPAFEYKIRRDESGAASFSYSLDYAQRMGSGVLTEQQVATLKRALIDADVAQWDGFHKSNPAVLDGYGFSLVVRYADGTSVNASGSNMTPNGYGDAKTAIRETLAGIIDEGLVTHRLSPCDSFDDDDD